MSRFRAVSRIAYIGAAVLAAAVGGCTSFAQVFEDKNEGGWFAKKVDIFSKPDWAVASSGKTATLGPQGPVGANDLVGADGRCVAEGAEPAAVAPAAASELPADRAVGSMAGDLAGAPMPAATPVSARPNLPGGTVPNAPQVMGGIALGMTECQAVQRAGTPGNVTVGVGEKGERKVVLTYLTGVWPGIYHFADGRLKEIARAPVPPPPKAAKKQKAKTPVKPKTVTN